MENWKQIENTNYYISNLGRLKNIRTGNILKTQKNRKGYHTVRVTVNKTKVTFRIHRLVAFYFVENTFNKSQVNHIDGNKDNNTASNLEWVTNKENVHHAIKHGLWDNVFKSSKRHNESVKKPIVATNIFTKEEIMFSSIREAEKVIGTKHINAVINKIRSQSKGYTFRYLKG